MSAGLKRVSENYISHAASQGVDDSTFSLKLVLLLNSLLSESIQLNPVFVDVENPEKKTNVGLEIVRKNFLQRFGNEVLYNEVFDPFEDKEFVTFSLLNDLCEIYESLSYYLYVCKTNEDLADWLFNEEFRSHLYQHTMNAIKVLYIHSCKDQ